MILLGIVMLGKLLQPLKVLVVSVVSLLDNLTELKLLQLRKALLPILVTVLGILIAVNAEQFPNAFELIVTNFVDSVMLCSELHLLNAYV